MKRSIKVINLVVILLSFSACKKDSTPVIHIAQSLLDTIYTNTYEGIIPCPDCPGMESSIRIYNDSTISRTIYYEGKNELPITKVGTWKLKDSVFIATFEREKLFFKIKDANKILRVGSDLKEVEGEFASDYILHKQQKFTYKDLEGIYTVGDTLNLYNSLQISHQKKDNYTISLNYVNKLDSLTNCSTKLNAVLDKTYQLNAPLKNNGNLRVIFTKKEAHVVYENIHKDSVAFTCSDTLRLVQFQGSYKKN